jgi:beta-mannosidase
MRKKLHVVAGPLLGLLAGVCFAQDLTLQRQTLNTGWEFREVHGGSAPHVPIWKPASVPGDVHLDLLNGGLIPDPFYRDNVTRLQWIEDSDWEYRDSFQVDADLLATKNVDLVFDGLDTDAEVYVNGKLVLTPDNMFRAWRVPVKGYLKPGLNALSIMFPSPIKLARQRAEQDGWRTKNHVLTPEKTYLRKAAYEYGWDWGPRLVTSGIWRPVRLEGWNEARISNLYVRQVDTGAGVARLNVEVEVTACSPGTADLQIDWSEGVERGSYLQSATLHEGVNHLLVPIEIVKPHLWFPAGYGSQPLYLVTAKLKVGGSSADEASSRVGLRTIVLRRDVDQWGRSFEFVVNGIPIFAKGASVIPFDSFPSRVTAADYRRILESARDANMNMVRQWGGGYYESDEFYEICDELGIMVWQDFMFSNEWQPGTYAFKQNVEAEVEYQVRRLRNHPSILLWCGNNETEASWAWPRTVEMTRHDPEIARHMWQNYLTLFSGVVGATVEKLDAETPFWPSSPSADYEDTSGDFIMPEMASLASPQSYVSGDMHNYGIKTPDQYEEFFPRFMSEYGWLSFPDMRTIERFTLPGDRTGITDKVMLSHQDTPNGNADILREVRRRYGEPKDLSSLVYLSQLAQAEWVKTGAEHLRRNRPRTMGSLFWQLNDCWPVASRSSIDYYGRWKALQYYAKRFYAPLLVSPHVENGALAVYVVSDSTSDSQVTVRLRIMLPNGTVLNERNQPARVPALSSAVYLKIPMDEIQRESGAESGNAFAVADLFVGDKMVSRNLLYFSPVLRQLIAKPEIHADLADDGGLRKVRLSSTALARGVYLSFGGEDVRASDNYFDLLPNEERVIELSGSGDLERLRRELRVISLADALMAPVPLAAGAPSAPE